MKLIATMLLFAALAPAAGWKQLFNGKDMSGWGHVGPGRFLVENGMLKTEGGMGLLWYTGRQFGNTTLRVIFKTTGPTDNSGVYIRFPETPKDPWYAVHNGYEVQIDAAGDDWHCTGAIYSLSRAVKRAQKPTGEWNTMEIELRGQETIVNLNGERVNDFFGNQPVPERKMWFEPVRGPRADTGYIGLQNHDGSSTIYFKEVSVKE
jgi:3-keto-disaccharide hydrolase